jgi:hypothetical protein
MPRAAKVTFESSYDTTSVSMSHERDAFGDKESNSLVGTVSVIIHARLLTEDGLFGIARDIADTCKGCSFVVLRDVPLSLAAPLTSLLVSEGFRVLYPECHDGPRRWFREADGKLISFQAN